MATKLARLPVYVGLCILENAAAAKASPSAISLHVSHSYGPATQAGLLTINCSLDASLANMETVATLTVQGSKPYGSQDEFDQLAVVDMWSDAPRLSSELEDSDVVIRGETGPDSPKESYLVLTWNSPIFGYRQFYKCVANGIGRDKQAKSVSTIKKVKLQGPGAGCCNSMDSKLHILSEALENLSNATSETAQHVQTLPSKIEMLETKLTEFHRNMVYEYKLSAIDHSKFDVSEVFGNRVYAISTQLYSFNIANQACRAFRGYLLEVDNEEEYDFVYGLVTRIGGANSFWTGGNDIDQEGTFVYYNSKKPVPALRGWYGSQPDNAGGREDCMEIRPNRGGLNDWVCSGTAKIVCEVPLN